MKEFNVIIAVVLVIVVIFMSFLTISIKNEKNKKLVNTYPLGKAIDSSIVMGHYPRDRRTIVQTEKSNIVLYEIHTIDIGVDSHIDEYDNGDVFFCQDSQSYCYLMDE